VQFSEPVAFEPSQPETCILSYSNASIMNSVTKLNLTLSNLSHHKVGLLSTSQVYCSHCTMMRSMIKITVWSYDIQ
jgi:hypothetical protein